MDGFEKWGIDHLSHSSVEKFLKEPAMWVLKYIYNVDQAPSVKTAAGRVIEKYVALGLQDHDEDPNELGMSAQDELVSELPDAEMDKRTLAVPLIVPKLIEHYRPFGPLVSFQRKFTVVVPELSVPFIGFYDFEFPDSVFKDLKTTGTKKNNLEWGHRRQASLQAMGVFGAEVSFTYAVLTKEPYIMEHKLIDPDAGMAEVIQIGRRIERLLSVCDSPKDFTLLTVPDPEFYQWDRRTTQARIQHWGF